MVHAPVKRRGQKGFTLVEIAVGLTVLALAFVCLTAYSMGQRRGLHKSSQLADATQAAATALETLKGQLADSASFKKLYDQASGGAVSQSDKKIINKGTFGLAYTIARAPSPLYALKIRVKVTWESKHTITLGMLYPGASKVL
jgi:prepilin-type N-terminal cleavage/methylation domain-containing protein